ncbi:unnamed protein product [Clonostachys rhizophaga]|uniref:Uncharacterized protein n=1 Tax=Clonostachys rhizophaga TaxID=160324 RepID=A0A9N9VAD2_9HYPO|nr:unnamed protein product [Clonostachys rhizophaga]
MSIESLAAFRRTGRSNDLAQLAEKHLEHDLQDSDREILQQSVAKVGTHATLGSVVGLGLGILFAYRLRRGQANAFKALRAAEKPTHVQFADGKIVPIPDLNPFLQPSVAGDIATYFLVGVGGLFLGGETGFLTGTYSADRLLQRNQESQKRIEQAFRRFRAELLRKEADRLDGGSKILGLAKDAGVWK